MAATAALRAAAALPAVRRRRCRRHRPVRRLRRRTAAQPQLLQPLRVAAGHVGGTVRAVPASRAAVGCGVGTVPLWLAAGPAGIALQVRRGPGRRPRAGYAVAARTVPGHVAAVAAGGAVASRPAASARLQPGAGAGPPAGARAWR